MKNLKYILTFLLLGCGLFFGYVITNFDLFDNELIFLDKLPVNNSNYSILIYKYPSSSTIDGAIQIHLIDDNSGKSKLYKNYDKYNKVAFVKLLKQKVLRIGLQDTVRSARRIDTINIILPNRY